VKFNHFQTRERKIHSTSLHFYPVVDVTIGFT
jgi:hypothetical protein